MMSTLFGQCLKILAFSSFLLTALATTAAPLPGAIFTTDSTGTGVDLNIYDSKDAVYLDGGPKHPGAAGLPDGSYYVMVTDPSGSTLLGTSVGAANPTPFVVVNGEPASLYQLAAILIKASDATPGYDDTPNPGGEYKVWVSTDPSFTNDSTKTDNFKVRSEGGGGGSGEPDTAVLQVQKFYDANANGILDPGEMMLNGWQFQIMAADNLSLVRYTPISVVVDPGMYTVLESNALEPDPLHPVWIHTTATQVSLTLAAGETQTAIFGNVAIGKGGGLTLGFWSNKNGQGLFTNNTGGNDLQLMVSLNLRNANGSNFDPGSYSGFRTWLLNATATNMAYMLSAQLSAMELNVLNLKVSGSALVYAPQLLPFAPAGLNSLGFISINDLMTDANVELGLHGLVLSGSPDRPCQEALKNVLDAANNDLIFVLATPPPFSF